MGPVIMNTPDDINTKKMYSLFYGEQESRVVKKITGIILILFGGTDLKGRIYKIIFQPWAWLETAPQNAVSNRDSEETEP